MSVFWFSSRLARHHWLVGTVLLVLCGQILPVSLAWAKATPDTALVAPTPTESAPVAAPALPALPVGEAQNVSCLVEPALDIQVGTPVEGFLEEVNVDRGDRVTPGQPLARLNAGVEQALLDYQAAKVQFGQRRKTRTTELHQKNMIAEQEVDGIATELRLAEWELKERGERLKLRTIVSPIHGVVVDRYHSLGDLVKQEKIFRIAKIDVLHVETVLPAQMFGHIAVGQTYAVHLPLLNQTRNAKVSVVDRVIDAASGTFRVRLVLPNKEGELPAGVRCQIDFTVHQPSADRPAAGH
ncbi:MAG: efflux RND transporter periplasmic adaptor subunit [Magnetococcales bacterium]|nr:efflux RND transporter periplasmic adaptor subunit [Magnetococcales bacterium]